MAWISKYLSDRRRQEEKGSIKKMAKKPIIYIQNMNQHLPNTCGSCKHTDNDLGIAALHCQLIYDEATTREELEGCDWGKVRSWNECQFNPSKWEPLNDNCRTK